MRKPARVVLLLVVALGALDAHLDQLMGLQRALDLGDDVGRKAVARNGDDGAQVVRAGAEFSALGRGQLDHGHLITSVGPGFYSDEAKQDQ